MFASPVGRVALIPYRFRHTVSLAKRSWGDYWRWLFLDREVTNYSYYITNASRRSLAEFVDRVSGRARGSAWHDWESFAREGRHELCQRVAAATRRNTYRWSQNPTVRIDQRLLYYLLVRAVQPRTVFQSGTARGVGACLVAAALRENARDGHPGRLVSTDLDPTQGYGIVPPYSEFVDFVSGDSVATLRSETAPIDLYIHDTIPGDQALREFSALRPRFSPHGLVISTWSTPGTRETAREWGRPHHEWADEPQGHWYRGTTFAVIGGAA
jgi:hypothetical protein